MELQPFFFRREGSIVGLRAHPTETPIEDDVNRFALRPLKPDEFAVFTLDLCHNQIDRHFSRFPDEELETINRLVVGRPLMERHDLRGSLPRGTFFRSRLHRDGDRTSVRPDVYVLQTPDNASFILNIEGGVYRETSIGFAFQTPECSVCGRDLRACDHIPGRTYGDVLCHSIMRNVLEVIEGSVVASGSQGTGFVAGGRSSSFPDARTCDRIRKNVRRRYPARTGRTFHRPVAHPPRKPSQVQHRARRIPGVKLPVNT